MKKILLILIVIISLSPILLGKNFVLAIDNQTYISVDSNSPIEELYFDINSVFITINSNSSDAAETILLLSNHGDNSSLKLIKPNFIAADISEMHKKIGVSFDAIENQLDLQNDPTVDNVIQQIEDLSTGVYPYIDSTGRIGFKITNPEIIETDDTLQIKLFQNNLLNFTLLDENSIDYNSHILELSN